MIPPGVWRNDAYGWLLEVGARGLDALAARGRRRLCRGARRRQPISSSASIASPSPRPWPRRGAAHAPPRGRDHAVHLHSRGRASAGLRARVPRATIRSPPSTRWPPSSAITTRSSPSAASTGARRARAPARGSTPRPRPTACSRSRPSCWRRSRTTTSRSTRDRSRSLFDRDGRYAARLAARLEVRSHRRAAREDRARARRRSERRGLLGRPPASCSASSPTISCAATARKPATGSCAGARSRPASAICRAAAPLRFRRDRRGAIRRRPAARPRGRRALPRRRSGRARAGLDRALDALRRTRALILDLRMNGGGFDALALDVRRRASPIASGSPSPRRRCSVAASLESRRDPRGAATARPGTPSRPLFCSPAGAPAAPPRSWCSR